MLPSPLAFALLVLLLSPFTLAWQPDYILRISNDTIAADCTARRSTVINGTSPGPEIRVKEGDHVWVRVYNDMEESNTTLHWQYVFLLGLREVEGKVEVTVSRGIVA